MFDDIAMRAVFIGASILIILFVFSLIIVYYNQAKDITDSTSLMSIDTFYVAEIEAALKEYKNDNKLISGKQLKNIMNYYYKSEKVVVEVNEVKSLDVNNSVITAKLNSNINACPVATSEFDENLFKTINYNIDPDSKYTLKNTEANNITTYKFELKK